MGRDFDSHDWADSHGHLANAITALIDKVVYGFKRLTAIQYDAPWKRSRR